MRPDRHYFPLKRIALILGLAVLIGLGAGSALQLVQVLGMQIPQKDLSVDYLTAVYGALGFLALILFIPIPAGHRKVLFVLWLARCFVTLGAMLFYEHNYGLDAFYYFELSQWPGLDHAKMQWGDSTLLMGWLGRGISAVLPLGPSFHFIKVCFSFVGLLGVYFFYLAFRITRGQENLAIFYLLGLIPSMLFWSSIYGKDPLNLLGIGIYTYGVVQWLIAKNLRGLLWVALGVLIASAIRQWAGVILLAPLALMAIRGSKSILKSFGVVALICIALVFSFRGFLEKFNISSASELIQETHVMSRSWARGGSGQKPPEFTSLGSMIKFWPLGAFTALFRPLPGEVMNPFGLVAGLENAFLIYLLILSFFRWKRDKWRDPFVQWSTVFIFSWTLFYAFISYQNLGAAVRFKLQILPILLGLLVTLSSKNSGLLWKKRR